MLLIRFRDMPNDISRDWLLELTSLAVNDKIEVTNDYSVKVDLEFTGPYGGQSDDYKTPFLIKLKRLGYIKITKGHHLSKPNLSAGIQPLKTARKNIWFTGENQRPPYGKWDGYFSFETKFEKSKNVYLPLWMLICTNLMKSTNKTFWGQDVPDLNSLLKKRKLGISRKKFCCSFIGKTYTTRLHALESLSKIESVDVYGQSVRNIRKFPGKDAKNYRFCLCFENDIYPGYITEKPFEAYISGTIPLYFGYDIEGFINPKSVINLMDFGGIEDWRKYISKVHNNEKLYKFHYEQPILQRKPDISDAVQLIRSVINS